VTVASRNHQTRNHQTRSTPVRIQKHFEVTEFEPDHRLTIRRLDREPSDTAQLHPQPAREYHGPQQHHRPGTFGSPVPGGTARRLREQAAVAANLDVLKQILERVGARTARRPMTRF
jgi:hypothetical protein